MDKFKIYCGNCGRSGHTYKKCTEPVTSVGIIAFNENEDYNLDKILLIRRKDSIGFSELLRGRYDVYNKEHVKNILEVMTHYEISKIQQHMDYDSLWDDVLNGKLFRMEYNDAKSKFNILKNGVLNYTIESLIKEIEDFWDEPEWGIPKGRRHIRESDVECAKREFEEETGFTSNDYEMVNNLVPLEEYYVGFNNVRYKHIYYFARIKRHDCPAINPNNISQACEIGDIGWFRYNDAIKKIRPYHNEKICVLKRAFSMIRAKKVYFDEVSVL